MSFKIDNRLSPAKQFDQAMMYCKQKVSDIKTAKYEIAKIAIEVCDEITGGSVNPSQLTIGKFADGIEVGRKTLYRWIREYRVVVCKLTPAQQDAKEGIDRKALDVVLKKHDRKSSKADIRKAYSEIANEAPIDRYLRDVFKRLGNMQFAIN